MQNTSTGIKFLLPAQLCQTGDSVGGEIHEHINCLRSLKLSTVYHDWQQFSRVSSWGPSQLYMEMLLLLGLELATACLLNGFCIMELKPHSYR